MEPHLPPGSTYLSALYYDADQPQIEIPAVVIAGSPFTIRIKTDGGGCTRVGPTEIVASVRSLDIRPFDIYDPQGARVCPMYFAVLIHETTATLPRVGLFTIHIHGRRVPFSGGDGQSREVTVSKMVIAR